MRRTFRRAAGLSLALVASAAAHAAPDFTIGAPLMFSGPGAFTGESIKKTLDMLVAEANMKGGIAGRRVRVVYYDTEGKPDTALRVVNRMLRNDGVEAIIGPVGSWEVPAVKRVLEAAATPTILMSSARAFVEPPSKCIFKVPADDRIVVERIFEYLKSQRFSRAAIVTTQDAYGDGGQIELKAQAKAQGIDIVADEKYTMEDTDLAPLMARIRRADPQVVINWSASRSPILITNAYRQMGLTQPFVHGSASQNDAVIKGTGANGEGLLVAGVKLDAAADLPASDPQRAVIQSFQSTYRARYGSAPNQFAGTAYDGFQMMAAALIRANGKTNGICHELTRTNGYVGVSGIFSFSETDHVGVTKQAVVIYRLQAGKWVLVR